MYAKSTFVVVILVAMSAVPAFADTISPSNPTLSGLDHSWYYTWGINTISAQITSASLTINDIYDWKVESDILYVHLLDSAPLGVTTLWDGENPTDAFAGRGVSLFNWSDPDGGPPGQDLVYNFTAADLAALNSYIRNDGVFGFGFDPDCHYYNDGITFTYVVPEPATLLLLSMGLVTAGLKRRLYS